MSSYISGLGLEEVTLLACAKDWLGSVPTAGIGGWTASLPSWMCIVFGGGNNRQETVSNNFVEGK